MLTYEVGDILEGKNEETYTRIDSVGVISEVISVNRNDDTFNVKLICIECTEGTKLWRLYNDNKSIIGSVYRNQLIGNFTKIA